jgi:peptidoglycan/LPS O-acetylase OafA/YrhL
MGVIRFLLALAVIVAHSSAIFGIKLVGGEVAVQTFFIVSGFYMALILTEKYVGEKSSFYLFITNRLLKLYPIYWTMLLIAVSISVFSYVKAGPQGSEKINNLIVAVSNGSMSIPTFIWYCVSSVFLVFQDWFVFLGISQTESLYFVKDFHAAPHSLSRYMFVPQAWTIGLEITFYLMAPFLVRRSNSIIIFLLFVSILIRAVIFYHWGLYKDPWSYRFFPSELAYFLIGILAYRFYRKIKDLNVPSIEFVKRWALPFVVIMTLGYQWVDGAAMYVLYPLLVAVLIPFIFLQYKKSKFDLKIGELSYPIYMSHITLIIVIQKFHIPILQSIGTTATIVTVAFSYLLNEFVSKRVEKYRQQRVAKPAALALSGTS